MIRDKRVHACTGRDLVETCGGGAVSLEPESIRSLRSDVAAAIRDPVECRAAPFGHEVRLARVFHRDQRRNRAECMTRRQVESKCGVTQRKPLAIACHYIP